MTVWPWGEGGAEQEVLSGRVRWCKRAEREKFPKNEVIRIRIYDWERTWTESRRGLSFSPPRSGPEETKQRYEQASGLPAQLACLVPKSP